MKTNRFTGILVSLMILTSACPTLAWTGKVIGVTDGDTIRIRRETGQTKTVIRVRLNGVDCPEQDQPFGAQAKKVTSELTLDKWVDVDQKDVDQYGRTVAVIILPDSKNLEQELVARGMAWWYRYHAPEDKTLQRLEKEARKNKRGLWSDPNPMPPWDWRRAHKQSISQNYLELGLICQSTKDDFERIFYT